MRRISAVAVCRSRVSASRRRASASSRSRSASAASKASRDGLGGFRVAEGILRAKDIAFAWEDFGIGSRLFDFPRP